ncbi:MAG TPA: hypothetical protein VGO92_11325 [Acidimicrobiales bacterium]|jgi:hypothetical protein|nr:hypothetical protein [Acidimicrobiales bacterium]
MRQAILLAAAAVAVVGAIVFGISRVADVSPLDQPTAAEWDADANASFGGADLTQNVIELAKGAREWQEGTRPTEQFRAELDARHAQFLDIRTRLQDLKPYPYDKRVKGLYLDSAQLYIESVNVYRAMVDNAGASAGLRTQLDLLARRLRALGDRVFDRGHALVKPRLAEPAHPDLEVRLPEEVPNWTAEGLAPGPPLAATPPGPPATEPQLRQAVRPEQPRTDWLKAVAGLGLPTPSVSAEPGALTAAAERLRATPDPEGDREESARIRLALLVQAEAVWAARAGLTPLGQRLLLVGDDLWSGKGLPERRSGLDRALLRQS